jgi:copper chaperone CopZ
MRVVTHTSPELEAAIFRALKDVPGVTVTEVEISGRPALAVAQTEDWLQEELLLDRRTYAYLGERSTVVKDTVIRPEKAGNESGRISKGHKVLLERLASGIVDEAGDRP